MCKNEFKNDCKRLRRRESESVYIKRRIRIMLTGWYHVLYNDGSGNRILNPKWIDYIGSPYYRMFKNYYSKEPDRQRVFSRYKKKKQYFVDYIIRKETDEFIHYEITADCRLYRNKGFNRY